MNSVKFPNIDVVESQAADWVAKIDRGLSHDEQAELSLWLEESPTHGDSLVKCAAMWDLLDVLSPIAKLMPVEKLHLYENDHSETPKVSNRSETSQAGAQRATKFWPLSFAAAATVVLVLGFNFTNLENGKPVGQKNTLAHSAEQTRQAQSVTQPDLQTQRYKTAVGEMSKVTLVDGSVLQLNTNSEVNVRFSADVRQLELLSGEVFFEVAKDPTKPFIVDVGSDQVMAVGTAFNIDARPGHDTEVLVTEGKVKVNVNSEKYSLESSDLFLTPGQKVTIRGETPHIKDEQDADVRLSWREGMLIFEGESLAEAIREIDRYTSLSFTIMDESVAQIPVGGFFKTGDTEQLLLILKQNFGVQSKRNGDQVLLYKKR